MSEAPGIALGLLEYLHGLRILRAERGTGDVDIAVVIAMKPRSFFGRVLPAMANLAVAPNGVDFDIWPPVFE